MLAPQPWLVSLAILGGHFGFWLMLFNRINATGLARQVIKRTEKVFAIAALMIPVLVCGLNWSSLNIWLSNGSTWWPSADVLFNVWACISLATVVLVGPLWLLSRHGLKPSKHLRQQTSQHYDVSQSAKESLVLDRSFRRCAGLPGNQITQLEVTHKELELPRFVKGIDGLKIGHLSDIHLTGKISQDYYHFAINRLLECSPDLIVIAGDIVDYERCLPWIEPILGRLKAPLGCSYVLGNHDRRLNDIAPLVQQLRELGFHDLGMNDQRIQLASGARLWMTGNERPWFERREMLIDENSLSTTSPEPDELRLGLSHSPDQINWARRMQMDVMLAGHTHGGQIRIPWIGPLVAPSYYGSRFASGVFYLKPTLMHVSRGLSGVHPFRWFCPPEISLLTLKNSTLS